MKRHATIILLALGLAHGGCGDDDAPGSGGSGGGSGAATGAGGGATAGGGAGDGGGGTGGRGGSGGSGPGFEVSGDVGVFQSTMDGSGDLYVGLKAAGDCGGTGPWLFLTKKADMTYGEVPFGTGWSVEGVPAGEYEGYAFFDVDGSSDGDASPQPSAGDWIPEDAATPECPHVVVEGADVGGVVVELDATM